VLRDLDLFIPAGRSLAIVGENGAGKTTLVKLLARLYEPTAGCILVDGVDLRRLDPDAWRARIAAGFQDFARFELLAREAVGVGHLARIGDAAAVRGALGKAGAAQVVTSLPRSLETQLGRDWHGGVDLSGGEWQRLALGRAFMREGPLLLVLDEPTAAIDAPTEHALFERFAAAARSGASRGPRPSRASGGAPAGVEPAERATPEGVQQASDLGWGGRRGTVTLLISHRFSTVRMADLILVLDGGRVIERGSHEELMQRRGLYAELFELQAAAYR
jgi:ATP-binding cassette subfamily B protein